MRQFRFAVVAAAAPSGVEWAELARRAEGLGFALFTMPDHFDSVLAPAPALAAAASATTTIRLGVSVFANDFRQPAVLAKEAATLDLLSGGRFELGIGAGWLKTEYDQAGIPFGAPGERVTRLFEAVHVIKGLWGVGPFSFAGKHYTIDGLDGFPKPLQQPYPPIYIGGGGKRLLEFASREADIVGLLFKALPEGGVDVTDDNPDALERKLGWVRAAAGERFAQLELATLIQRVIVTDDRAGEIAKLASEWGLPVTQIEHSPYFLIGSVDQIVERLLELRARYGLTHVSVFQWDMEALAPVVARLAGQ
jgi:probable F420-dependent oxidoreductase